jgi:hypothetical protein
LFPPSSSSKPSKEEEAIVVDPLKFKKLPKEILFKYQQSEVKLRGELVAILLDDNLWHLRSWDTNYLAIVKIHCEECMNDFEGSTCNHSNFAISSMFANFKKIHLYTALHICNLCRRQGLPYNEHPQFAAPKGNADSYKVQATRLHNIVDVQNACVSVIKNQIPP